MMIKDNIVARSIGLRERSEWGEIDRLAQEFGVTPHALSRWMMRHCLKALIDGDIKPETIQKTQLVNPNSIENSYPG